MSDIRDEIAQANARSSSKSPKNKLPNVKSGPVLNPSPISVYNPSDVKETGDKPFYNPYTEMALKKAMKSDKGSKSVDVVEQFIDVGTIIANTLTDLAKEPVVTVKDKDKEELAEKEREKEKMIEKKLIEKKDTDKKEKESDKDKDKENEKEKEEIKESDPLVTYKSKKGNKSGVPKEKVAKPTEKEADVLKEKVVEVPKETVSDVAKASKKVKKPAVVKSKPTEKVADVAKTKVAVVKGKPTEKVADVPVEKVADVPVDKVADVAKAKVDVAKVQEGTRSKRRLELPKVDQSSKKKKMMVEKDSGEKSTTKRKRGDLVKVDDNKKKQKLKQKKYAEEKKKKVDSSGSDEDEDEKGKRKLKGKGPQKMKKHDSANEEDILSDDAMKELMKRFLMNSSVKAETDEDNELKQKGNKKGKVLTTEEMQHQDYVSKLPILHARTAPTALHTAIHGIKNVDVQTFLLDIGFGSFFNLQIDYIPSRLSRYIVKNFDEKTCRLKLEKERFIEVTVSTVHNMLGIPIGGESLLSLPTRSVEDKFEDVWKIQFSKKFKEVKVNDVASKLIESKEVDFLFKINFLTLFVNTMGMCSSLTGELNLDVVRRVRENTDIAAIDWCAYIFHCLKNSRKPTTDLNKYTGPYTFLVLFYLDSTKCEKVPVLRTRPAIKQWSSFLMKKRQELELKEECFGMSELFSESDPQETESSLKQELLTSLEEKLSIISKERASFEDLLTRAGLDFPGDSKLTDLHEKYVKIFKHPVGLNGQILEADDTVDDHNGNDNQLAGTDP